MTQVPLATIARVFSRIGISSFGGGLVAWMHREAVERRRWLGEREFLSGLALSQLLPGANMVNLALFLGLELRGGAGALAAVLGLLTLPIVVCIGLAAGYDRIAGVAVAHLVLDGIAAAAVGLNIATGIKAMRRNRGGVGGLVVTLLVLLGVGVLHWPMPLVLGVMVPSSLALAWLRPRHG